MATLIFAGNVNASILTVNNNTTSPGTYNTLTAAIAAAHSGDTLLVAGSPADYAPSNSTILINKPLTLWGTGFNLLKDNPVTSKINQITLQSGSSGTVIVGFVIGGYLNTDGSVQINNIVVKRNWINILTDSYGDGWLIQENLFGYGNNGIGVNGNNIQVKNNIFQGSPYAAVGNSAGNTNFVFSNNLVFNWEYTNGTFYNALVTNNIFYDSSKTSFSYVSNNTSNTLFSNNIVYGNPYANPFYIGANSNTEAGNRYNTDPQFTNLKLFKSGYQFYETVDLTSDLTLKTTSPGHNTGTDTKDIGLYGGAGSQNPVTGNPAIPQISTMNILNTVVAPGTTLNVQIRAKSNN